MSKFICCVKLIRYKNLSIIVLSQFVIKFYLINSYLKNTSLTNIDFCIYLFALITIVAGGYIINDLYDVDIDKINKPHKIIIGKEISRTFAFTLYYMLNITGTGCGFYVSYVVNELWFGCIFLFFIFSLYRYSKYYKKRFLIGNIQVAFLTALSIISLAIFDIIPLGKTNNYEAKMVFFIVSYYAGFSFITTLIREIIKDIEDIKGDQKIGGNTLAISYGIEKTKKIVILLIITTIIGIAYFQFFQYSVLTTTFTNELRYWGVNIIEVLYTCSIQILLIFLAYDLTRSNKKSDFQFLSVLSKIIMIFGILSIPLFTFLHLK